VPGRLRELQRPRRLPLNSRGAASADSVTNQRRVY